MSIHVISWVLRHSNASGNDRMALLVFADHADDEGENSWPSADTIAFEGRMARSTAVEARKRLVKQGRLIEEGKDPLGKGITRYRVRMEVEEEGPPPERRRDKGVRNPTPPDKSVRGPKSSPQGSESLFGGGPTAGPEPSKEPSEPSGSNPPTPLADLVATDPVRAVFVHWAQTMKPRRASLTPDVRQIIREALKVATPAECMGAITGCARSDFHMRRGQFTSNRRRYNQVSDILRGKRGRRTVRESIDMFLDFLEEGERKRVDNWGRERPAY